MSAVRSTSNTSPQYRETAPARGNSITNFATNALGGGRKEAAKDDLSRRVKGDGDCCNNDCCLCIGILIAAIITVCVVFAIKKS